MHIDKLKYYIYVKSAIEDTVKVDIEILEDNREFTDKELKSRPEKVAGY